MKLPQLLMKMTHETVTVELKDGVVVSGTIQGADIAMNMHLRKVTLTMKDKSQQTLDTYSIRGNNIRYVIIPDSVNLDVLLVDLAAGPKKKSVPKLRRFVPKNAGRGRGRGGRVGIRSSQM